jgi:hypothetical protein
VKNRREITHILKPSNTLVLTRLFIGCKAKGGWVGRDQETNGLVVEASYQSRSSTENCVDEIEGEGISCLIN